MRARTPSRFGMAAVVLLASVVGGCLEGEKRIGVQYDRSADRFVFLVLFNHISSDKLAADGGDTEADADHLQALWNNRDHLILLPGVGQFISDSDGWIGRQLTDDGVGWLRVSATRYEQLSLGGASTSQPRETRLALDTIQIKPGKLFNDGGSNLCYYHQVIVPGALVDKAIDIVATSGSQEIVSALDNEIASRAGGVATGTWDEIARGLIVQIDAVPDDPSAGQDAAAAPLPHGFSLASLRAMRQAVSTAGRLDLSRSGSIFTMKMPMTADDAAGIAANWPAVRDAALAKIRAISEKLLARSAGDASAVDPRPAARALAQSINVGKDDAGLVVSVDVVVLGQFLSDWESLNNAALSDDDRIKRDALSKEMGGVAATKMPVDHKLTVAKVMADFANGTLASVPATQPVTPGTGLEINP